MKQFLLAALLAAGTMAVSNAQTVNERRENQQDRIAQGVKSGQLTPHETAKVERQEGRINRQVRRDRAANGGKLTPAERHKVNRELNHTSREIHRDKHNARTQ
ncbi:MAG: hypothetical protein U0Q18_30365 [Bryobacteraceae bacterium]